MVSPSSHEFHVCLEPASSKSQPSQVLGRMAEEPSLPSPNGMTFSAAISACCEEQTWPWALGLLEDMQIRGISAVR